MDTATRGFDDANDVRYDTTHDLVCIEQNDYCGGYVGCKALYNCEPVTFVMARTKQTARISNGGRAPRKQLATKVPRSKQRFKCDPYNEKLRLAHILQQLTTDILKQRESEEYKKCIKKAYSDDDRELKTIRLLREQKRQDETLMKDAEELREVFGTDSDDSDDE